MSSRLSYRILGPLEVADGDQRLTIARDRPRALLGALILAGGAPMSASRLVDDVWGPAPPATADTLVRLYVSQLRETLGADAIVTTRAGYALADAATDAERFRELVADGDRLLAAGDDARAQAAFAEALELWSGPLLGGTALAGNAAAAAAELEELRLHALEERYDAGLRLGRHHELVADLERAAASHPRRERIVEALMLALYRSGRHADALAAFQRTRRHLVDELGLDPGPRLQELQSRILRHDPELAAAPASPPARAASRRSRPLVPAAIAGVAALAAAVVWLSTRPEPAPAVSAGAILRVDAAHGRVAAAARVGRTGAMLADTRQVWVVDTRARTLQERDAGSLSPVRRVALRTLPHALMAAAGRVWLANQADGTISAVGPRGGVGAAIRPEPRATGRLALAYGDGSLWIGAQDGRLTRFDPVRGRASAVGGGIRSPEALAVAGGSVWVAQATSSAIARVDEATDRVVARIPIGGVPDAIVAEGGSVWALVPQDGRLWQIDPRSNAVVGSIPAPGATLLAAAGASLWIADAAAGTITRALPRPTVAIAVSHPLAAISGRPGALYATTR